MVNIQDSGNRGRRDTPVLNREDDRVELTQRSVDTRSDSVNIDPVPGQLISGQYRILALLGKGGMGAVYLVADELSGKRFAMKSISTVNTSARAVQRFQLEARATSLLNHPNLVQCHDFGLINGEQPYFIMDYCEGRTLADLINDDGPLPEYQSIDLFITICNALAYAHSQSVVHRDLKPSNIMITKSDGSGMQVKVLDFGIAKVLIDETAFNSLTRTGEIFGSPYYMSPEQCNGKQIDYRSDIYSLGCVFFETLVGIPPFMSENPLTTMLKHQSEPSPTLKEASLGREFSADLETIIARMLAKTPELRYDSLLHVVHDLQSVKRGESLASQTYASPTPKRSYKMWAALAATATLIGCAALVYLVRSPVKSTNHPPPPAEVTSFHDLPGLPAWESLGKSKTVAAGGFFSDAADVHASKRTFHFPAKAIGSVGYGPDDEKFLPARGEMTLNVPFAFVVGSNAGVLTGFRADEIDELGMSGLSVDDAMTQPIRNWRLLRRLNLEWADIGDQSIANLQTLPNLTRLSVSETHVSPSGLQQLHLEKFVVLDANHIMYAGQILPRLGRSKAMEVLKLGNTGLKDSDLKFMVQMPNLTVVDISGNSITDRGIETLSQFKQLNYLWFSGNPVTAKCIHSLKKLPRLSGVTLSMNGWSSADKAQFLKAAKQMNCKVSDAKHR